MDLVDGGLESLEVLSNTDNIAIHRINLVTMVLEILLDDGLVSFQLDCPRQKVEIKFVSELTELFINLDKPLIDLRLHLFNRFFN
jgi:hypothetical protein